MRRRRPTTTTTRVAMGIAACLLTVLLWGENAHRRASHRRLGHDARPGQLVVVVLGWGNHGERANTINRYRVRAGLRTLAAHHNPTTQHAHTTDHADDPPTDENNDLLVVCGGAVSGTIPEADILAAYARRCGYTGPLQRDRTSRTTDENVRNAIPFLEHADAIALVSDAAHAEKARAHLWRQRPDLAARLIRGQEYRFGEMTFMKPAAALIGRRRLRRMLASPPDDHADDRPDTPPKRHSAPLGRPDRPARR